MWQLLREWPPGYGGVERVAHELASAWQEQGQPSVVFSFVAQNWVKAQPDPLAVRYRRVPLPHCSMGRLLLPLPSLALLRMLRSSEDLHVHLPCPAVLLVAVLARLVRPRRLITLHWHSFLEPAPTPAGRLFGVYQRITEWVLQYFSRIITTSPVLKQGLLAVGVTESATRVLPCCLPAQMEAKALEFASFRLAKADSRGVLRLISIGRLDSYKRVDWLLDALAQLARVELQLDVIGDGPDRDSLEQQAERLAPGKVFFHGRVEEERKWALLAQADLLILPANRCHEAFGIAQLEAMASAVPSVAFEHPLSGTAWVSRLECLAWDGTRESLPALIEVLSRQPDLLFQARKEAHARFLETFSRPVWSELFASAFAP